MVDATAAARIQVLGFWGYNNALISRIFIAQLLSATAISRAARLDDINIGAYFADQSHAVTGVRLLSPPVRSTTDNQMTNDRCNRANSVMLVGRNASVLADGEDGALKLCRKRCALMAASENTPEVSKVIGIQSIPLTNVAHHAR